MNYLFLRQYIYDLLRRSLIEEPNVEFLTFIQQVKNSEIIVQNLNKNVPLFLACIESLKDKNLTVNSEDFENLHWDFTQLFIGPHRIPAPPWESSYKNERLLFSTTTSEIQQLYQQYGFELDSKEYEAADHLGFELDFIYHLNNQIITQDLTTTQLKENLMIQLQFIQQHLLSFIHNFTVNVKKHALTDFYKNLVLFCCAFIQDDADELAKMINHLD